MRSLVRVALMLMSCVAVLAQDPVEVRVEKKKDPAGVRYIYTVTNRSPQEIVTVLIGEDLDEGVPHLRSNPVGWKFKESKRIGYGWSIPRKSAAAPKDWLPLLVLYEETNRVSLSWIVKDDAVPGIAPGQTLTGFEIVIAREDPSFFAAPFTVIFADGSHFSSNVK